MKNFIIIMACFLTINVNAQITKEHSYADNVNMITLSDQTNKLVVQSEELKFQIYSITHELEQELTIDTASLQIEDNAENILLENTVYDYVTDKLFDNDEGIEFLSRISYNVPTGEFTPPIYHNLICVFDNDGSVIFQQESTLINVGANYSVPEFIYNTNNGAKMVIDSICYGLVGSLPIYGSSSQELTLVNDTLTITDGNYVVLDGYQNTDSQQLSFSNDTLYISSGNSVYLGDFWQQLALSNDTLYLTNGGKVYIGDEVSSNAQEVNASNIGINNFYPNPASSNVNLEYSLPNTVTNAYMVVFNNNGELLKKQNLPIEQSVYSFDLSGLTSGVYYVQILTEQGYSSTRKIIKIE
jgi:hypothetical protein